MSDSTFNEWCILELMGHRRLFGYVAEVQIGGASFLRLDVPASLCEGDGWDATQFYNPSAVYCMTPTTEALARRMAVDNKPEPVSRWEVRALESPVSRPIPPLPQNYEFGISEDEDFDEERPF